MCWNISNKENISFDHSKCHYKSKNISEKGCNDFDDAFDF